MRAIDFLMRATLAEKKLTSALEKVVRYRASVQRMTASLDGNQVSHSRNVTAQEDAMIRYIEVSDEAARLSKEKNDILDEIYAVLDQLENESSRTILKRFYIDHASVATIDKEMYLNRQYLYEKKAIALEELDELLSKS